MDGHRRTDARYFRRGTKLKHDIEVRRWSYLSGIERTGVRLGLPAALYGLWRLWQAHRGLMVAGAALVALTAAVVASWWMLRAWRERVIWRRYIRPLDAVLRPLLSLPPTVSPREYLTVPTTFAKSEDTPVRIILPNQFQPTKGNKEMMAQSVLPKLGRNEDNTDVIFESVGTPVMVLKVAPQPPTRVNWDDVIEIIESMEYGELFIGLGQRDKPFVRSMMNGESPHWGFSCNTGTGKSYQFMALTAQILHQHSGSTVAYCDPKGSGTPEAFVGVPGYTLTNDPDNVVAMWDMVLRFEMEMDRRRAIKLKDRTTTFPLAYLFLDELSEFADLTAEYWDDVREKTDKKIAPIWRSIARVLRLGREYDMRVIVATQRLDSKSTGGLGLRDLFGFRGLAGFRRNQWMMLIGTTPVPKSSPITGRWIYSDGFNEWPVQNVLGDLIVMREYALVGRREADREGGHSTVPPWGTAEVGQWDIVGLAGAAAYCELGAEAFAQRRKRAGGKIGGEGRVGNQPAFMREDLDAFLGRVISE
jgi:hypothetical protein